MTPKTGDDQTTLLIWLGKGVDWGTFGQLRTWYKNALLLRDASANLHSHTVLWCLSLSISTA